VIDSPSARDRAGAASGGAELVGLPARASVRDRRLRLSHGRHRLAATLVRVLLHRVREPPRPLRRRDGQSARARPSRHATSCKSSPSGSRQCASSFVTATAAPRAASTRCSASKARRARGVGGRRSGAGRGTHAASFPPSAPHAPSLSAPAPAFESPVRAYISHHNEHRPHRSLQQHPPLPKPLPVEPQPSRIGRRDRLGGLLHEYSDRRISGRQRSAPTRQPSPSASRRSTHPRSRCLEPPFVRRKRASPNSLPTHGQERLVKLGASGVLARAVRQNKREHTRR
jgi:hypothetical protein